MDGIKTILERQNPWWDSTHLPQECGYKFNRWFLNPLMNLALMTFPRRSVVVMGQRRIGKTVLLKQVLGSIIGNELLPARNVCYLNLAIASLSAQTTLVDVVETFSSMFKTSDRRLIMFDEIQVINDWPNQLKVLTDHYTDCEFVATGSGSEVLRRKSKETGYGRLLNMYIPPLLFCEYLDINGFWPTNLPQDYKGIRTHRLSDEEISVLNNELINYMNYGAFSELIENAPESNQGTVRADAAKSVLYRTIPEVDLPLIRKPRQMFDLINHISENIGREISKQSMYQTAGLNYRTVENYLEFLESTFIIRCIFGRVSHQKRMQRDTRVKYAFENAAFHSTLTGMVSPDSDGDGHVIEATALSQVPPPPSQEITYLRIKSHETTHEVDMAHMIGRSLHISRLSEIKWSDHEESLKKAITNIQYFLRKIDNKQFEGCYCTTRSTYRDDLDDSGEISFLPASQYILSLGLEYFNNSIYSTNKKMENYSKRDFELPPFGKSD